MAVAQQPASHRLMDVGEWYRKRLSVSVEDLQKGACRLIKEGRTLRVGTMCSGTDSPVAVMKAVQEVMKGKVKIEHVFSCEFDPKKREWIKDNFPKLGIIFGDVKELKGDKATNHLTNQKIDVPSVDIVIAGFVCKSVSVENAERAKYGNCINEEIGQTGETFSGVMSYCKKHRPSLVLCENVKGLTIHNLGRRPVIEDVKKSFKGIDYAFSHRVLETRNYLLPQRRNRCWMWAFDGKENQALADKTGERVERLGSEKGWSFDKLFRSVGVSKCVDTRPRINDRHKRVIRIAVQRFKPADRRRDIVVDIAKSAHRAPYCIDAAPCVVPNSMTYRTKTKKVLSPEQAHAVQGIYPEDFPALLEYARSKKTLTRDLAGNAFSTTVCMAVVVASFSQAPGKAANRERSPSPSRVGRKRASSLTPPRPTKARKVSSPFKSTK